MVLYKGLRCQIMEIYVKLAVSLTVQGMKNFQFQVASPPDKAVCTPNPHYGLIQFPAPQTKVWI